MPGFSGQGKVLAGLRNVNGTPGLMRWIGNASVCSLVLDEQDSSRNENFSGNRLPYRQMTKTRSGTINIKFDEFNIDNMALMQIATVTTVASGTAVTGYAFPSGAKVGSYLVVPAKNISAVALKDSTATPKVLTSGENYQLSPFGGNVELLDITTGGPFTQPFKMDYTPGAYTKVGAFNRAITDLYLQFIGINTDDGSPLAADIFRARLKPVKEFSFITDDYADFELTGSVLADMTRQADSADGQFFSTSVPTPV